MCCFEVIGPGNQVLRGAIYFVTGLTRLIQIQQNVLTLVFCDDDVDDDDRRAFSTHGRGCRRWSLRAVAPGRAVQVERTCPSTCIDASNIHVTKLARRLASSPDFPELFVACSTEKTGNPELMSYYIPCTSGSLRQTVV